jgi:putative transposase
MRQIDEIHLARPFLGSRRIGDELKDRGFTINRKRRVQRLMRLMGIAASYPKPSTSKAARGHKLYPYLLRGLEPERANQVWVADITYLPMARGFAYLVAVMDLYSRKILSWQLSNTLDSRFCTVALAKALDQYAAPEIFNTEYWAH